MTHFRTLTLLTAGGLLLALAGTAQANDFRVSFGYGSSYCAPTYYPPTYYAPRVVTHYPAPRAYCPPPVYYPVRTYYPAPRWGSNFSFRYDRHDDRRGDDRRGDHRRGDDRRRGRH